MTPTGRLRILREKYGSGLYRDTLQMLYASYPYYILADNGIHAEEKVWRDVPIVEVTVEQTIWDEEKEV